jgi:hypothetical protein
MIASARPRKKVSAAPPVLPAGLPDPAVLTAKGLAAFFRITESWGLNAAQQQVVLGQPARSTFFKWKAGDAGAVGKDTLERLSYVVGIYKALQILIPQRELADAWIGNPNDAPLFAGQPPLALLLEGSVASLYRVRAFLDAQRGGWG